MANPAQGQAATLQIGVSRPPLPLDDLPTPEEVFKVSKIGGKEMVMCVLGPSMIALGVSLGSGEWLLGPLAFSKYGFLGLGFLITVSAVLQVFYNVEAARYTLATGEVPIVGFTRAAPGYMFWVPATLILIYLAWVWGGWASAAGQSLFAMFSGRTYDPKLPGELQTVRFIAIGLMVLSLVIYLFGQKITRTLEIIDTFLVILILAVLGTLAALLVPGQLWQDMLAGVVTPAPIPSGMDATLLGAIIGYTGFASGMNFMLINYYRDHGYAMGHKVGFYSGIVGGKKQDVLPSGVTFRESERNTALWKRWFRYLVIDQWAVFFIGAMIGMFVPGVLVLALAVTPGAGEATTANMPVYTAMELRKHAEWLFPFTLILGALILFKTQTTILEMLIRNTTDAAIAVSPRLRAWIAGDPRKFYYILAVVFIVVIGIIIHLAVPTMLLQISANMANLAAIIFPVVLIYLNSKLPRPARAPWWANVILVLVVLFFGFFFFNFLSVRVTGQPLVAF
jgi:hypothetical protein